MAQIVEILDDRCLFEAATHVNAFDHGEGCVHDGADCIALCSSYVSMQWNYRTDAVTQDTLYNTSVRLLGEFKFSLKIIGK